MKQEQGTAPVFEEGVVIALDEGALDGNTGKNIFNYKEVFSNNPEFKMSKEYNFYNLGKYDQTHTFSVLVQFDLEKLYFMTINVDDFAYSTIYSADFRSFVSNYDKFQNGVHFMRITHYNSLNQNHICFYLKYGEDSEFLINSSYGYVFDKETNSFIYLNANISEYCQTSIFINGYLYKDSSFILPDNVVISSYCPLVPFPFYYKNSVGEMFSIENINARYFDSFIIDNENLYISLRGSGIFRKYCFFIFKYIPYEEAFFLISGCVNGTKPVGVFVDEKVLSQ